MLFGKQAEELKQVTPSPLHHSALCTRKPTAKTGNNSKKP